MCDSLACGDAFSVTARSASGAPLSTGDYVFHVDSDAGASTIRCTATTSLACSADAGSAKNVDIGSTWQGNALLNVYLTIYGQPKRATIRVEHGGAIVGEQSFASIAYTPVPNGCGQSCKVAAERMSLNE